MVLVLTCSVFASVVSAQTEGTNETAPPPAQDVAPEEGTNETAPPTPPANPNADTDSFEQTSNTNPLSNPDPNAATDAFEQSSANTSANGQSQTPTNPKQDGGSGNQDTSFSWKYLMPWFWVQSAMKILGNTILMIFGWVLGLVGLIFNFIIDKTIVNLKTTIDSLGVITDIWKVIRDFINLFFIFSLLYAAVGTILGLDKVDWKKTVGNLVLAALLINFSLFITKAALDLSNIVTIGFYSQLPGVGAGAINPGSIATGTSGAGGISNSIMQSLKLETIFKPNYTNNLQRDIGNSDAAVGTFAYILSTVMGSIFICVTIVVMVAACWLFLKRFIDIIFLMIRSPIAFAGFVLPQLDEYQKNWWKELQANVIFPPVYMAMMWITFKILQSPGFQTVAPGVDGFSGLFSTLSGTTVNIAFRFIVVIAMMVYALKSAGKVGVEGGEIFNDFLKKKRDQVAGAVSGAIGRNTVGRGAAMLQDKNSAAGQALRKLESVPIIGSATSKAITSGLKNVSSATFGGAKGGFDQMVKDEAKYAKEGYARVGEKREWREEFKMVEPTAPIMPERLAGESEDTFAGRMGTYHQAKAKHENEDLPEYEAAKVKYTARKETFDEEQKKGAEDRQKQFKTNYEKTSAFSVVGKNRPASMPFLGENRAALESIDKSMKEKKKDDDKKAKAKKDLERIRAEQLEAEEEMLASYRAYAAAVAPTAPVREAGEADAAFANRDRVYQTTKTEHETTTNRLTVLLKEKFEDVTDDDERKRKVDENKRAVKTALDKIKEAEEAVADKEAENMARQQAEMKRIEIQLAGLDEEKRTAEKPTTQGNIVRLQGELMAATLALKKLERAPNKRTEHLRVAESKKNEASTKREQVITRENQIIQEEKLESLGKDLGEVKDKTGKKDEDGGKKEEGKK